MCHNRDSNHIYMSSHIQHFQHYFSSLRILPGKADSVVLLGLECTINSQHLIKIVRAILGKIEFLIFFLMRTTFTLRGRGKTNKNCSRYIQQDLICRISTISVNWVRLYVRRRSYRHTRTHILFLKHIFRLRE